MYKIELSKKAKDYLLGLAKTKPKIAERIEANIDELAKNPLLGKKLLGELQNYRSLRVGEYRILYSVYEHILLVHVIKIALRKEIYR